MKNQLMKITIILFLGLSVVACKKAKNEVEANEAEKVSQVAEQAVKYTAIADKSNIAWKGIAPTKAHNGTIKVSEGYLAIEDGKLAGGNFIIDMNSIVNLDLKDKTYNDKLVGHLKSGDFFDVEKNAFSVFAITGVETKDDKVMVKGNLTIKGIKKNIEFPANVVMQENDVFFSSETFSIDRTEWDIKYKSGKFFEDLKDKFINDNIELKFKIRATKAVI